MQSHVRLGVFFRKSLKAAGRERVNTSLRTRTISYTLTGFKGR